MKPWALIASATFSATLLCGCASQSPVQLMPPAQLFDDKLFQPPSAPVDIDSVFAVSDAMRVYVQREIGIGQPGKDIRRTLFNALYRKDKLKLDYDSAMTRNAAQTFEARAGNCLSLAIMTAALARELNLEVQFQQIEVEESWSRAGGLYFASNHVSLTLGRSTMTSAFGVEMAASLTVDFIPIPPKVRENAKPLQQHTIVAMYLNNRAAEFLAAGAIDDAYWSARKAIEQDPAFLNAYNTLGVIYQHHGDRAAAERSVRHALTLAPNNTIFMANLAQTLESEGKNQEANELRARLAQLEPYPPFHFFNLGQDAMKLGDYMRARNLFQRELERAPDYHEFHFWLALADYNLGNLREADAHMAKALENSTTRGDHDLYAAKLDRIRAYENHPQSK